MSGFPAKPPFVDKHVECRSRISQLESEAVNREHAIVELEDDLLRARQVCAELRAEITALRSSLSRIEKERDNIKAQRDRLLTSGKVVKQLIGFTDATEALLMAIADCEANP